MTVEKQLRLSDIATQAGVSVVTVAKVLNHSGGKNTRVGTATAERIRQIAATTNYRPNQAARQLRLKKSGVIGVLVDSCAPPIYHQLLFNMEKYAEDRALKLMIGQVHDNPGKVRSYVDEFVAYGVDALICQAHGYPGEGAELAEYCAAALDTVFLLKPSGRPEKYCYVDFDIESVVRQSVRYLKTQGRQRLGLFVLGGYNETSSMDRRVQAFREALADAGMTFSPELIQTIPAGEVMNATRTLPLIRNLVEQRVDGIIAANDYLAAMALKGLIALKINVPQQVSVLGCDDIDLATLVTPALSTFALNHDACAKALIAMASALIKKEVLAPAQRAVAIAPTFIRRETA